MSEIGANALARTGGADDSCDRRAAVSLGATALMTAGLAGGYGAFFAMAGRYFFPSGTDKAWMFVTDVSGVEPGASFPFESPT